MNKKHSKTKIHKLISSLRLAEQPPGRLLTKREIAALDKFYYTLLKHADENDSEIHFYSSGQGLLRWVVSGKFEASSLFLLSTLRPTMTTAFDYAHPLDLGDFSSCVKLLEAEPALRSDLHLVAATSQAWANLVSNFEMIETLLNVENPDWRANYKTCKKTSELITKCINT